MPNVNTSPVDRIRVEVVLACAGKAELRRCTLPAGATLLDAVKSSGFDVGEGRVLLGIFGRRAQPGDVLSDGDRVEILRPLQADPKAARRARVSARRSPARVP